LGFVNINIRIMEEESKKVNNISDNSKIDYDKTVLGTPLSSDFYEDKCIGVMLGTACGDILGVRKYI
jgi:hypothetical protein